MGYDHQTQLSKHESQTDSSKGFGGKYGVQKDRQDKSAGSYDDMQEVRSSPKTDRGGPKGQASNFKARFEQMANQGQEVCEEKELHDVDHEPLIFIIFNN